MAGMPSSAGDPAPERRRLGRLHAKPVALIHDLRADARRRQAGPALRPAARRFQDKQLLQRNRGIVESGELDDAHDSSAAIGQAADMDDDVDGAADLLADGAYR